MGEVLNDSSGVLIRIDGEPDHLSRFEHRLRTEAPPLSKIETVAVRVLDERLPHEDFRITKSVEGEARTRVAADAATCDACKDEVFDPDDRRAGYPFANCTHCGPRFSIVESIPYDRKSTTMSVFPMCPDCLSEYEDPADRRFHAQPNACPVCGPQVWYENAGSTECVARRTEAVAHTVHAIRQGQIVAMRGLGGYHLVCDATNAEAVARLRSRKRRFGKPFALMAADLDTVRRFADPTDVEAELLESAEAPIVLLRRGGSEDLPDAIAPGLDALGFMLPYTPLHMLILRELDGPAVMTSGNVSHEPQVTGNDEARDQLASIADGLLLHDRDIANRIDDSVVRLIDERPRLIRRARGYAPAALKLPAGFEGCPDLLAFGGELKSTFCLIKDGSAVLSQHQGDLEDPTTHDDYLKNLALFTEMYDHEPKRLACDMHPEYLATKLAFERAADTGLPLTRVQHHHAHVASCLAESGIPVDTEPVLGIALDGLGMGADGTLWGGEFLLADYRSSRRLGSLKPVAMLGGVQAIKEPWRSTYAHLASSIGREAFLDRFGHLPIAQHLKTKPLDVMDKMLASGFRAPRASSCGRLFDAVAAAAGLRLDQAQFEGQGAMELEAAARRHLDAHGPLDDVYAFAVDVDDTGFATLDPTPMWEAVAEDLSREVPLGVLAARFHEGLAAGLVAMVEHLRPQLRRPTVVLTGGCFQNALLLTGVTRRLTDRGLTCLSHERLPTNDGGLALGQAAIAAATALESSKSKL